MPHPPRPRPGPIGTILAATVLVAGCAAVAPDRLQRDARFAIPVGSTLTLNRAIELPGKGNLLYLQHGRPVRFGQVQEVYPHCYVETLQRPEGPLRVAPTRFTVTEVSRSFYFTGLTPGEGWRFIPASTGGNGDGGGSLSQWFYVTRLELAPEDPGVDIYRLTCQADRLDASGPSTERHHLTLAHIREALGEVFTLDIDH